MNTVNEKGTQVAALVKHYRKKERRPAFSDYMQIFTAKIMRGGREGEYGSKKWFGDIDEDCIDHKKTREKFMEAMQELDILESTGERKIEEKWQTTLQEQAEKISSNIIAKTGIRGGKELWKAIEDGGLKVK